MQHCFRGPLVAAAALAALSVLQQQQQVHAHSWIDCIDTNRYKLYNESAEYIYGGSKGDGFCDGYGAGYPGRGDSDIGTQYTYKMLKNTVEAGTAVCETVDADTYTDTTWRHRLNVTAGTPIYFAYTENGHVVKDKMGVGTQHGIYWTGETGSKLENTTQMTSDHLVDGTTMDFDDGNCGETLDSNGNPSGRAGDGWPCVGQFTIPTGTPAGTYHFVWYWTFYLDDGDYVDKTRARGYFGASYSTCFEVTVLDSGSTSSSTTTTPTTTTATPVATTATPATTTATPVTTTATPVTTTATPVATTATPVATSATASSEDSASDETDDADDAETDASEASDASSDSASVQSDYGATTSSDASSASEEEADEADLCGVEES